MSKNILNCASIVIKSYLQNIDFNIFSNFYQCQKFYIKIEF